MKRALCMMIVVMVSICFAMAAYAQSTIPKSERYGGVYKEALRVGPATPIGFPPKAAPDASTLARPACESLVRITRGGKVEPILATGWKIAPDKKSIVLTLRKGVKFHDGTDFNAQAVKWNYDKVIEAKRARDWNSVDVIDDYTIRVNIKGYKNTVLTGLGGGSTLIISPTAVEKNGMEWANWHPVGTGPFIFEEFERDARLLYKKNPNYWDKGKPYLDGIEYTVIADDMVQKMAFQRGDIHILASRGVMAKELKGAGYKYLAEAGGTFVLIPDSKNADSPFADKRVRLAVSYALDREALAAALGHGFAKPAYSLYPGHEATALKNFDKQEYNPEKAKKLLADAGYPNGFKTQIHTFIRIVPKDFITAIANMLKEVGIEAEGDFPEAGRYTEYRFKGWKNSLMGHGLAPFDNMNTGFSFYFGGIQFPSLKKPDEWNTVYNEALGSEYLDPVKTQRLVKLIHDDVMVIPYLEETVISFYQEGVHLFDFNKYRLMTPVHEDIWLEPKLRK